MTHILTDKEAKAQRDCIHRATWSHARLGCGALRGLALSLALLYPRSQLPVHIRAKVLKLERKF